MLLALQGLPRPGMHSRGKDMAQLIVTAQSTDADWVVLNGHGSIWKPSVPCAMAHGPGCLATKDYFRERHRARTPLVQPRPALDVSAAVEMVETMMGEFGAYSADSANQEEVEMAQANAAALTSEGVNTFHNTAWYSRDFFGPNRRQRLLLISIGSGEQTKVTAVKMTGDRHVPAGWVSWVVRGQPKLGGTALNGVVQIRQDPADASTFGWARCVVQLM